uniref:Uncharacterized protein n=1 Tax=Rhizophora mucronata TaxID=61149 RepID=A0A2P2Q0N0_RHIMU
MRRANSLLATRLLAQSDQNISENNIFIYERMFLVSNYK